MTMPVTTTPIPAAMLADMAVADAALIEPAATAIRPAEAGDLDFLWRSLATAAGMSEHDLRGLASAQQMLAGWQRCGDFGFVIERHGVAVAAAWARQFARAEQPRVWIDGATPQIVIAVESGLRGCGFGALLLANLIAAARERGCRGLCLTVREENAVARRLYQSHGFATLTAAAPAGHSGKPALGMHLPFAAAAASGAVEMPADLR